jgi:D-alanine transaminase
MGEPLSWAFLDEGFVPLAEARISPLDRGFLFADAVYETLPVHAGRPFELARHLARLARSLRALGIAPPCDDAGWRSRIDGLVARNGGGDQLLYLQVSRGADRGRDHRAPPGLRPTVFMMCSSYLPPDEGTHAAGYAAITRPDLRWGRCDIKSTMLLANVMAREAAAGAGAAEAILLRGERVTEATSSALFVVRGGTVVTPALSEEVLPSVTRAVLLELLRAARQPVEERAIDRAELLAADEVWLANTSREVFPIVTIDGRAVGDGRAGPRWREAFALFQRHKAESWERPLACAPGEGDALRFPTSFPVKVMGRNQPGFREAMVALVARHAGATPEVAERLSGNGNFLALTLTFEATSREQLDALYRELTAHPLVSMAL